MSAHEDFFVGWANRAPRGQGGFLVRVALGFVAVMLLLALALARGMDDSGGGGGDWAAGEQTLTGIVTAQPYAMLNLAPDAAHPAGHGVMLSEVGKYPVVVPPGRDGHGLAAKGWLLRRGSMDMLQMTHDPASTEVAGAPPVVERLGRWRITGEICDGQCYVGAMRPGTGLAHRACADFCIENGVPPVFVSTAPVAGTSFLMMADAKGGPVGKEMYDYVGLRVRLDGEVERRGDVLMFKADFATAVVPVRHRIIAGVVTAALVAACWLVWDWSAELAGWAGFEDIAILVQLVVLFAFLAAAERVVSLAFADKH